MTKTLHSVRKDALEIFLAGLQAADAKACITRHFSLIGNTLIIGENPYNLDDFNNIYVIGFGKASGFMAEALEELLKHRIKSGIVNVQYGYVAPCKIVKINEAGHPIPDYAGIKGTHEIMNLLGKVDENDIVFCLISGGGSALFESPHDGISLDDIQKVTSLLLKSGANIEEINVVRKRLSKVKGGRLMRLCKGVIVSLILSDVWNDSIDIIASGPTTPDYSTFLDSKKILLKYNLLQTIPVSVRKHIEHGLQEKQEETPKKQGTINNRGFNIIIGNNHVALLASYEKAVNLGYHTTLISSFIGGEAREAAKAFVSLAREIYPVGNPVKRPACLIAGGETTVTVKGYGYGGRNQEFVLAAAMEICDMENTVVLSAGTDGIDGNTDAAGAIADSTTLKRSEEAGVTPSAFLTANNTYSFFKILDDLIITGPTRTNVMDIMLLLIP